MSRGVAITPLRGPGAGQKVAALTCAEQMQQKQLASDATKQEYEGSIKKEGAVPLLRRGQRGCEVHPLWLTAALRLEGLPGLVCGA